MIACIVRPFFFRHFHRYRWKASTLGFLCWFFPENRNLSGNEMQIRKTFPFILFLTCKSFLSFSLRLEFKSSCVIFCWSLSISSAFAWSSGLNVVATTVVLSPDVSFPSSVFVGTVTNPRAPRLRSFSRISMKFCENLFKLK